jgi:hypothetical protein
MQFMNGEKIILYIIYGLSACLMCLGGYFAMSKLVLFIIVIILLSQIFYCLLTSIKKEVYLQDYINLLLFGNKNIDTQHLTGKRAVGVTLGAVFVLFVFYLFMFPANNFLYDSIYITNATALLLGLLLGFYQFRVLFINEKIRTQNNIHER